MNTTDLLICCWEDDKAIKSISAATGIEFLKVSDGSKAGGSKVLIFEAYGACYGSLGKSKIDEIIAVFKSANFDNPEFASLTIDDDNGAFRGIVLHTPWESNYADISTI